MLGKKAGDIIIRHIREVIAYKIWLRLKKPIMAKAELQMHRMGSEAASARVVQLLISWFQADMPFSSAEMAEKSDPLF